MPRGIHMICTLGISIVVLWQLGLSSAWVVPGDQICIKVLLEDLWPWFRQQSKMSRSPVSVPTGIVLLTVLLVSVDGPVWSKLLLLLLLMVNWWWVYSTISRWKWLWYANLVNRCWGNISWLLSGSLWNGIHFFLIPITFLVWKGHLRGTDCPIR